MICKFYVTLHLKKFPDVVMKIQEEQQKQKNRHDQQKLSEPLKINDKVLVERTWLKTNFSSKLEDK